MRITSLLTLLASAAIVSATGCAQNNIGELAARSECGRSKTITKCLRNSSVDLARLEEIERCFIAGGCEMAEATAEAVWFAHDCRASEVQEKENELRRRADSTTESVASTTHSTTARNTAAKSKSTTATVASTSATTTSESSTSESTTSSASTASSTSESTSVSTTSTGTAASAITTGTLACSVTSTVATSMCSVSAGKTISCFSTTTAIATCAPGMICFISTTAADVCMKRDNSLTTSGLVVTIVFAVGLVAAIIAFVIIAIRDKSKTKALQRSWLLEEASSGRKDVRAAAPFSSTQSRAGASESNLPLVTPGGQRSDAYSGGQQDYFNQGQAPRLNPGLGALGQERY